MSEVGLNQELVSAFKNDSSFLYLLLLPRQTAILWHFDYVATKSLFKSPPITSNYSIVIVTLVLLVTLNLCTVELKELNVAENLDNTTRIKLYSSTCSVGSCSVGEH
jgi:hypothetical protein